METGPASAGPDQPMRQFMDHDPYTGITTEFEWLGNGKFHLHYSQDVEPLLEQNKALQNDPQHKRGGIDAGFQHVATIPNIVIAQWRAEGIDIYNPNHTAAIKRKLRDPAYRHLRTTLGDI